MLQNRIQISCRLEGEYEDGWATGPFRSIRIAMWFGQAKVTVSGQAQDADLTSVERCNFSA